MNQVKRISVTNTKRWVVRIAALLIGFPIGLRAATEAEISRIQDTKATIQAFYDQLQQNTRRLIRRSDGPPQPRAGSVMRVPVAGPPGTILLTGLPTASRSPRRT